MITSITARCNGYILQVIIFNRGVLRQRPLYPVLVNKTNFFVPTEITYTEPKRKRTTHIPISPYHCHSRYNNHGLWSPNFCLSNHSCQAGRVPRKGRRPLACLSHQSSHTDILANNKCGEKPTNQHDITTPFSIEAFSSVRRVSERDAASTQNPSTEAMCVCAVGRCLRRLAKVVCHCK